MVDPQCQPVRTAYAQTNLQLFSQLQHEGYFAAEATLIRNAYELAMHLYAGYFISSGREQMAHVVGTAGILSSLHVPAEVVAAGLIHNVYTNGDFGVPWKGLTTAKRRQIVQAVGQEVEKYIDGFYALTVTGNVCASVLEDFDRIDAVGRFAVLILIAEQLEHRLNDGLLKHYTKYVDENGPVMAEIALKLGFPQLADQILTVLKSPAPDKSVLSRLIAGISNVKSRWIPPASCRRRVTVTVRMAINRGLRLVARSKRLPG